MFAYPIRLVYRYGSLLRTVGEGGGAPATCESDFLALEPHDPIADLLFRFVALLVGHFASNKEPFRLLAGDGRLGKKTATRIEPEWRNLEMFGLVC